MQFRVVTTQAQRGLAADRALADLLGLARGRARTMLLEGRALCDGRSCPPARRVLRAGEVFTGVVTEATPEPSDFSIVFQDEQILAVAKPAGLQTHAGADRSRPDLVSLVQARLGDWGLLHRLDKDTSGLILFARPGEAQRALAREWEERRVEKGYLCWVQGLPRASEWSCALALRETRSRVLADRQGQPAHTDFRELRRQGRYCLVEARPRTGRKHQIRVHLAAAGLPIVGDSLYGKAGPRMLLHAAWLEFVHPDGSRRRVECPPPADFHPAGRA